MVKLGPPSNPREETKMSIKANNKNQTPPTRYTLATPWCRLLRNEITRLLENTPPGLYEMNNLIIRVNNEGITFLWITIENREILVAWGNPWKKAKPSIPWRCLDKNIAKIALYIIRQNLDNHSK